MCIQCGNCKHEPTSNIDDAIDKAEATGII
jgi:hypothetical protein